ncbi:MAG: hypothetical protein H6813_03480 [Phycisphaeraceae bacterium]|nr:hypothetical protein [Phycisphaeraceae bacterium]MCB9847008.1 hypothetical protein [Phycisphaeraceae bacterium]
MSSIDGQALFNSGPHRFIIRSVGTLYFPPLSLDFLQTSTELIGPIELAIHQTGRLVSSTESGLWSLVDAIKSAGESQLNGTLIDNAGTSWSDMTFLRFRPDDRVDRGRVISLAYQADYIRLA